MKTQNITTTIDGKEFVVTITEAEISEIVTKAINSRVKALAEKENSPLQPGNHAWSELKGRRVSANGWSAFFEAAGLPATLKGSADRGKAQAEAVLTAIKTAGLDLEAQKAAVKGCLGDFSKALWKPVLFAYLFPETPAE